MTNATMTEQEYLRQIHELEKQVLRLQTELKKNSETQYGLRWMDVPEAFEVEAENAIPTLEEVPGKAISNDDGKPTHILIEGDNFHALTCLNYTHKGQIDVIYIDPPYNTGSDGFVYKDKRVLDKFPDGTTVPTDHPLRHSYWLSFMHKRLELAKNLLSDRGVIFISIDDNEQANLKLLCDQVFGEKNFVGIIPWRTRTAKSDVPHGLSQDFEWIICYATDKFIAGVEKESRKYYETPDFPNKPWRVHDLTKQTTAEERPMSYFTIVNPKTGEQYPASKLRTWAITSDTLPYYQAQDRIVYPGDYDFLKISRPVLRYWKEDDEKKAGNMFGYVAASTLLPKEVGMTQDGTKDVTDIFGEKAFGFPKPVSLIQYLLKIATPIESNIKVLDFFGGSGTTMHATMQLNEEDGGHRQCILVQQNENNICEAVTYERNKRVMQGYTNAKGEAVAGLGNSMKYYRTAFVGEHKITDITDADKVALTQKAGCLLALGENNLEEIKTAKSYQIFQLRKGDKPTNDFGYTAVYFSGNLLQFADFRHEIEQIQAANPLTRIAVYVFTWGDPSIFENEFDDLSGITIKPIPQPILEIYQNIHQL